MNLMDYSEEEKNPTQGQTWKDFLKINDNTKIRAFVFLVVFEISALEASCCLVACLSH